jgi:hypothetical protein
MSVSPGAARPVVWFHEAGAWSGPCLVRCLERPSNARKQTPVPAVEWPSPWPARIPKEDFEANPDGLMPAVRRSCGRACSRVRSSGFLEPDRYAAGSVTHGRDRPPGRDLEPGPRRARLARWAATGSGLTRPPSRAPIFGTAALCAAPYGFGSGKPPGGGRADRPEQAHPPGPHREPGLRPAPEEPGPGPGKAGDHPAPAHRHHPAGWAGAGAPNPHPHHPPGQPGPHRARARAAAPRPRRQTRRHSPARTAARAQRNRPSQAPARTHRNRPRKHATSHRTPPRAQRSAEGQAPPAPPDSTWPTAEAPAEGATKRKAAEPRETSRGRREERSK